MRRLEKDDFRDVGAERAVLAGIYKYGGDAFVDVEDLLDADAFTDNINVALYKSIQYHYADSLDKPLDMASILSSAKSLGLDTVLPFNDKTTRHLRAIFNFPIEKETVRREAQKLQKLDLTDRLDTIVGNMRIKFRNITGDESLQQILSIAENPIFDFSSRLNSAEVDGPGHISSGIDEFLDEIEENPQDNIGISSGFARYDHYIGGGFRRGTVSVVGARMKVGKAQSLTSQVLTPNGPVLMGDLRIGNKICTPDGGTATIESIHPQGMRDIYRVVFSDGDSVKCDLDHLWNVRNHRTQNYHTMSLRDIVEYGLVMSHNNQARWHVPLPEYCHYDSQLYPMNPYLLGLLLGNGGFTTSSLTFTSADKETIDRLETLLPPSHSIIYKNYLERPYDYYIQGQDGINVCIQQLRQCGLWGYGSHHKFIPDIYKYNSKEVRLAIIQGLCDTDGSVDKRGNVEYSTVSKRLAYDIKEVIESLGGICTIKYRQTKCQTGKFWSYRVRIKHNDCSQFFQLTRKKQRTKLRTKRSLTRTIRRVEYIGRELAQCIKISSKDGLYLTDNHVVTHNTILCDNIALHVAGKLKIPVLNLDTEMSRREHQARILAYVCGIQVGKVVSIREIESGKYVHDDEKRKAVRNAAKWLKSIPYEYESVREKSFDEHLATMRRWVRRRIGTDAKGITKDCLVIYDYLQAPEPGEFNESYKEYQILGYQTHALMRTSAKCDVPIFTLVQLNRDGIDKENTSVAADSDRVLRKAANFAILKWKAEEELAQDGPEEGTHKLVPIIARHGEAMEKGDYINIVFEHSTAKMTEGRTRNEIAKEKRDNSRQPKGYEVEITATGKPPDEEEKPINFG